MKQDRVFFLTGFLTVLGVLVVAVLLGATSNPARIGMFVSSDGSGNPGTWAALKGSGQPSTGGSVAPSGMFVSVDGSGNPGTWAAATSATFQPPISRAYASGPLTTGTGFSCCSSTTWTAPAAGLYRINFTGVLTTAGTGSGNFQVGGLCGPGTQGQGYAAPLTQLGGTSSMVVVCRLQTGNGFSYSLTFNSPGGTPVVTYDFYIEQLQ